jgi:HPr kinase/phosphorylase
MLIHGSVAAKAGSGVLLLGAAGSGKSDLLLRLVDRGFDLVADDQVLVEAGVACAPDNLAGMVEARGLGIIRLPYMARARLALVIRMERGHRLPMPARYEYLDLPMISLDPWPASAPYLVELALAGALGNVPFVAGAFS